MRIIIDIDGDEVKVQRVVNEAQPPADLLARAAAAGAESAGAAHLSGGNTVFAESAANHSATREDAGQAAIQGHEPNSSSRSSSKSVTRRSRTKPPSKRS